MANLTPVPWEKIENNWTAPAPGSAVAVEALSRVSDSDAQNIRAALAAEDRQALFAAITTALAKGILQHLEAAEATLGQPEAAFEVAQSAALYRAFEDGILAADKQAAHDLGRAWLVLNSSLGSTGILNNGAQDPNVARFAEAQKVIVEYIETNYLPSVFVERGKLTPAPESAVRSGTPVVLPATLPPGSNIADQRELPRLVLQFEEAGEDEANLPLVAYGDMLFDSPEIFSGPARELGIACSTCHNRSDINQRFFIPGASHNPGSVDVDGTFFNPMFNDRRADPIDIPSLRGLRFTGPYGRDGRFASIRDFTRNVIVNEFAGAEPTPFMLDAIVAYMTEFDFLPNAMLTGDGRLTDAAPEAAWRGEAIFNRPFDGLDGQSCASCHVPNGNFLDRQAHDIGSVTAAYEGSRGGALDTPTLLGTVYTAPHFHDGSMPTLASVVDWFDTTRSLGLTEPERADLTAYLETVGAADEPYEVFDAENTPFRLAFAELTTFASTLDALLPRRDAEHILLLTDTVAADLSADAGTMANLAARPEIYSLAERLAAVGAAVRADDWAAAEVSWAAFQSEAQAIEERAF